MRDVYGEGITAKEVLKDNKVTAPVGDAGVPDRARTLLVAQRHRVTRSTG